MNNEREMDDFVMQNKLEKNLFEWVFVHEKNESRTRPHTEQ